MLPELLAKLYSDCQKFAEMEITQLLQVFTEALPTEPVEDVTIFSKVMDGAPATAKTGRGR
jgi:hypothetical protein